MTITYSLDISSSTFLGIHRLLFRWRGSIWKSILPELICWLLAYFALSFSYRYAMDHAQRRFFEQLCKFFGDYIEYIPITFMLGFYVSAVFGRWNQIFDNLGWIDSPALLIATYVRGADEEACRIRRNIVRYLILVQAMVYRDISSCVQKRFPTMDHLVTAGIMTAKELKEFDAVPSANIKYWTPIQWAFLLLQRAKDKKMIESDIIYTDILEKIRQFRVNVLTLTLYDWVPIPLVYTQVVNLAVRSYFIVALLGRQYMLENVEDSNIRKTVPDLIVPIMTIFQFLFYIGWIKVAEVLLNPMGEDDDDFETNWIIDRNLQVGLSIVDDCYGRVPDLERDVFWEEAVPEPLYTPESAARPHNPMVGSCNDVTGQEDALLIQPRRRRLMSTMTSYDNTAFFKQSGVPTAAVETENGMEIIPVENHNPTRRLSVCANPFNDSSHRVFESVRQKFSKAPNARRDSTSSTIRLERTLNERLTNCDRPTPRDSISITTPPYSPNSQVDNAAFTQSLNFANSRPSISEASLNHSAPERFQKSGNEDLNSADLPRGTCPNIVWAIDESMLPIIEEVQARLKRNTGCDSESMNSSDSSRRSHRSSDQHKSRNVGAAAGNNTSDDSAQTSEATVDPGKASVSSSTNNQNNDNLNLIEEEVDEYDSNTDSDQDEQDQDYDEEPPLFVIKKSSQHIPPIKLKNDIDTDDSSVQMPPPRPSTSQGATDEKLSYHSNLKGNSLKANDSKITRHSKLDKKQPIAPQSDGIGSEPNHLPPMGHYEYNILLEDH